MNTWLLCGLLAVVSINGLTPATGKIDTVVTIRGAGFAADNNTVKFGPGYIRGISSSDGTTIKFTVPAVLDLCRPDHEGPCPGAVARLRPGEYQVAVITRGETTASMTFVVTK